MNPCYILEESRLRHNLALIRDVAERAQVEIILAFKAYALWRTFPIFREYIHSSTASSPWEARMAYEEFGAPAHSYSPAYTDDNWPDFLKYSSHITFNSLSQLQKFTSPTSPTSFGLRVNPEYSEIQTELYNPCAPGSRFGVLADELQAAYGDTLPRTIEGFHCHCHCEDDSYTLERTLHHLEAGFGRWLPQLRWLNLGGGHLMTRKDYDVDHLVGLLQGLHRRYPNLHIILEPGSAFAWQTGDLVAQVVDIVCHRGIRTAILNVSFACHMPDCLEMPYQPQVRGARIVDKTDKSQTSSNCWIYRLGGNSCLSGDFVGDYQFDHELQVGKDLYLEDMLHYTTVKTNLFNGIQHPAIALRHLDGSLEVLREFTYEDYLHRMD